MFVGGIQISLRYVGGHWAVRFLDHMQITPFGVQRPAKVQMPQLSALHDIKQIADSSIVQMKYLFLLICDNHTHSLLFHYFASLFEYFI